MKIPDDNQWLGLVLRKTDHLKLSLDNEGSMWGKCVNELITKCSNCTAYIFGASTPSIVTWTEQLLRHASLILLQRVC